LIRNVLGVEAPAFEDDTFIRVVETASDDGPSPLPASGIRRVRRCAKAPPSSATAACWTRTDTACRRPDERGARAVHSLQDRTPAGRDAAKVRDWHLVPGLVERHPAILVFDPGAPDKSPKYFVLLDWSAGKVTTSAISATSVTSSMALIIGSERNS
jgi:hypothetical protein